MTDNTQIDMADADEFVLAVHEPAPSNAEAVSAGRKTSYAPWHHPVKQIVRQKQWSNLTYELMKNDRSGEQQQTLRYFTLPGADLLDVRVLADALVEFRAKVEYFGFNSGLDLSGSAARTNSGASFSAESALRQAGLISDGSLVLRDRLEDIALAGSHAQGQLDQQQAFDVVNIDACDHLGYKPLNRARTTFDALEKLLAHQLASRKPWLLFITTRADPTLLGPHFTKMQSAVSDNLRHHQAEFGPAIAECLGADIQSVVPEINQAWAGWSDNFLKLYSVGLGKYLLHYFHAQAPVAADVELKSVYAYKVKDDKPDMLSFAFRILPQPIQPQPASIGGASVRQIMEAQSGVRIAQRASRLWMLDDAIADQPALRAKAVEDSARLLDAANYDLDGWRAWLAELTVRPMIVAAEELSPSVAPPEEAKA